MSALSRARLLPAVLILSLALVLPVAAATITIVNTDGAGEGFNDPTPVTAVGGNPGTTIGAQRLYVFQYAANVWGSILPSAIEIRVSAAFNSLACTATAGTLGATSAQGFYANSPSFPYQGTLYPQALANKLSGLDNNASLDDMSITFNSDVDNQTCLGSADWYYGVDGNEGTDIELLPVVLHEMAHGLGFTSQVASSGSFTGGLPSIYSKFLLDDSNGLHWDAMTNTQRAASYINTGNVVWDGPAMNAQSQVYLDRQRLVTVTAPAAIAGPYRAGIATFGADVTQPVVTAPVILADDGVADLNTHNGCSPLINAAQLAGKIALIDRGGCTFLSKALAAQNAGAAGVIIADTISTPIALDLGGTDPSVTIPAMGITMADANLIKGQLGGGVTATMGGQHAVWLSGADNAGHTRIYAPNPVESGSSISHFDRSAVPNLLMEPAITTSLYSQVDLTRHAFRDLGWFTGSTITAVPQSPTPDLQLASAPNPFDGATTVSFRLGNTGPIALDVYGVDGRHVRRLAKWAMPAGTHAFTWNGLDDDGRAAPPGVYLVRLDTQEGSWSGRVVRLR